MRRKISCVLMVLLLARCMAGSTTEAPAPVASARPSVTPEERASATDVSEVEAALPQATDAPSEPSALPTAAAVALFKDIAVGVTDDGFPVLGEADAPVTLIDYSDFL